VKAAHSDDDASTHVRPEPQPTVAAQADDRQADGALADYGVAIRMA
jgi:hypothetical protein